MKVKIGKSEYSVAENGNPEQIGGVDPYVVVSPLGKPILVLRSNGQTFHVTYKQKRAARATARNLTHAGLPARVYEKQMSVKTGIRRRGGGT